MIELKTEYPYIDEHGNKKTNLIKHFAEDEKGNKYYIFQKETGKFYLEAIDVYPCKYTYEVLRDDSENEEIKNNNTENSEE